MIRCVRSVLIGIALMLCGGFVTTHQVFAATLSLHQSTTTATVGQTVTMTLVLDTGGKSINAGEGTVSWSDETLQFVSVSTDHSIFSYWPVRPVASDTADVRYSGGLTTPGYAGPDGQVLQVTFVAKAPGNGTVSVYGAKVLANDGGGSELLLPQQNAVFTIASNPAVTSSSTGTEANGTDCPAPTITSPSHPDQQAWYRAADATISWNGSAPLQHVSYTFSQKPNDVPDDTAETRSTSVVVSAPTDGVWYFNLKAECSAAWSATAHYIVRVDRTPPATVTAQAQQSRGPATPNPAITFSATDVTSGIARYTYLLDDGRDMDASSPVVFDSLLPGPHTVLVTAWDRANNVRQSRVSFSTEGYPAPIITSVTNPLILLDPIVVRGTALAGDTITVYLHGQSIGQTVAGPADSHGAAAGVTVRMPWSITSRQIERPGSYALTATATATSGATSAATDPQNLRILGQAVLLGGRPIATLSVATPVAVVILLLVLGILFVMVRLVYAVVAMHRRTAIVETELETLRIENEQQELSRQQLTDILLRVEGDLTNSRLRRNSKVPPRSETKA